MATGIEMVHVPYRGMPAAHSALLAGVSGAAKLEEAVAAYREALKEWTRERAPRDWAMAQHSLGEALSERTRERVPLQWANSIGGEGFALLVLAARRRNATIAEIAVSRINTAFETMRNGGDAARAAYYGGLLTTARAIVAQLRGQ